MTKTHKSHVEDAFRKRHESIETTRRYIDVSERARKTRLSANAQHVALGTRNTSGPRWLDAALGGGHRHGG